MQVLDGVLVGGAGLLAGAVNAIAGGGTLITFPALLATGMPALTANITSSVGLLTGYAGGAAGYRRELAGQAARLRALGPPALLGGLAGAVVLLVTPADAFRAVAPYLVLLACMLLTLQNRLAAAVARRGPAGSGAEPGAAGAPPTVRASGPDTGGSAGSRMGTRRPERRPDDRDPDDRDPDDRDPDDRDDVAGARQSWNFRTAGGRSSRDAVPLIWPARAGVFAAGVYGSYFGAGLGVLLIGVLGILVADDMQRTTALKMLLSFGINVVGVAVFVVGAQVSWAFAAILLVTSAVGGLLGASVARRLDAAALRGVVVALGVAVALVLLVRG